MNEFERMLLLQKEGMYANAIRVPDCSKVKKIMNLKSILTKWLERIQKIQQVLNVDIPFFEEKCKNYHNRVEELVEDAGVDIQQSELIENLRKDIENLAFLLKESSSIMLDDLKSQVTQRIHNILSCPTDYPLLKEETVFLSNLLDQYSFEELYALRFHVDAEAAIDVVHKSLLSESVKLKLLGLLSDCVLNKQLKELGMSHNTLHDGSTIPCARMIITTQNVTKGLADVLRYLKDNANVSLQSLSPIDIPAEKHTDLEIAWGILDSLTRHGEDNIFVTTSFYSAGHAVGMLQQHSTLVLDGHGSKVSATFGEYREKPSAHIASYIHQLIAKDKKHAIDHIILQSCTSGELNLAGKSIWKKSVQPGKERVAVYKQDASFQSIHGGLKSLAESVYQGIRDRRHTAFTFSEHIIIPSLQLGQGNVAIMQEERVENRKSWPENITKPSERKSITVISSPGHRKAPEKTPDKYQQSFVSGVSPPPSSPRHAIEPTPASSFFSPIAKRHDKNNIPEFPSFSNQVTEKHALRRSARSPTSVTALLDEDENVPKSP